MIATVMCGGRASRMQLKGIEKPLLKLDGIPMVERVILALAGSKRFDRIIAAVSLYTPGTKALLESKGIDTIETSGEGYSNDLSYVLSELRPQRVMVVPSDIPLLTSQLVSEILDVVDNSSVSSSSNSQEIEQAISIILEKAFVEAIGGKPSIVLDQYCHSGITVFNTMNVGPEPVEEHYLIMNRKEIALNVNTKEELELAKKLLV